MKQCVKHLAAAVLVFVLLAVFAGNPAVVSAAFSGSYKTEDAYEALAVGDSIEFDYLHGTGGYAEERQVVWAVREDGTLAQTWYERILGSSEGIPYFCIEQNAAYVAERTAVVYDGLDYMSQEEITRIALALKYLEDHIEEVNGSKTDLYYLQQFAVWKIRDEAGYDAYGEPMNYGSAGLESKESGEASVEFSIEIVGRAIAWADENSGRYTGYCKVLDSGMFQRCAVFKAVENPVSFVIPETGSAGTIGLIAAGGILILAAAGIGNTERRKEKK